MSTWANPADSASGSAAVVPAHTPAVGSDARLRGGAQPYARWVFRRVLRVRLAPLSLGIVLVAVLLAFLSPLVAPYDPTRTDLNAVLDAPGMTHLMGTDELGRDLLSRIIFGSRASLSAGVVSTSIALLIGTALGLVSGYFVGLLDLAVMRVMDALLAFPGLVLALAITAALGPSLVNVMLAIGIVGIPHFARLARGQVLTLRDLEYVISARSIGAGDRQILVSHIVPNMLTPIVVQASLSVAFAILTEASLSFLGLGVQPPTPSWGFMLNQGRDYIGQAPWLAVFPGVSIFLVVMAFNLLGDAIRDALDPRLRI
jgi:peptide/nickel transport system permease protein